MMRRTRIVGVVLAVPDRLSRLANRIRRHYDPNFLLIGPHVTVLPPREIRLTRREVVSEVRRVARRTPPLLLSLGPIRSFQPVMPVVFASLREGAPSLIGLHRRLSGGRLRGAESFPYVPHLTLGQALDWRRLRRALALARRRFAEAGETRWQAEHLIVVERLSETIWLPLPPVSLKGPVPRRRPPAASSGSRRAKAKA
jgi:2'-5' RNA ligase